MTLMDKIKATGRELKKKLTLYRLVLKDPRTPRLPRVLLWLAIGYTLLPFDLIPDFLPIIGHIDDVIIVPLLIVLALRLIPIEKSWRIAGKRWVGDQRFAKIVQAAQKASDARRRGVRHEAYFVCTPQ